MDKQITSLVSAEDSSGISAEKYPMVGWIVRGTDVPSLVSSLLEKSGYRFSFFKACSEKIPADFPLLLVDCSGLDVSAIQKVLAGLHDQNGSRPLALLCVESNVALEPLIRWPGVKGIFPSACDEGQILKGMQSILRGENWLPRRLLDQWLEQQRDRIRPALVTLSEKLTEREQQILNRVGEASTNAQIAFDLCISEHTVKTHLYNIYRKIKVRNRTEASNWVKRNFQMAV